MDIIKPRDGGGSEDERRVGLACREDASLPYTCVKVKYLTFFIKRGEIILLFPTKSWRSSPEGYSPRMSAL